MAWTVPLVPCPSCRRHLFARSAACPFCGVHLVFAQAAPAVVLGTAMALSTGCHRQPDASALPDAGGTGADTAASAASAEPAGSGAESDLLDEVVMRGNDPRPADAGNLTLSGLGASGVYGAPAPTTSVPKANAAIETVGGDADRIAESARVVASLRPAFRRCYALGLHENPQQTGAVLLDVSVSADGAVSKVTAKPSGTISDKVASCIAGRFRSAQFAPPTGGTPAKLVVTVKLSPQSD